jgi:hypothetical protein
MVAGAGVFAGVREVGVVHWFSHIGYAVSEVQGRTYLRLCTLLPISYITVYSFTPLHPIYRIYIYINRLKQKKRVHRRVHSGA